jgi:hypothetical protein
MLVQKNQQVRVVAIGLNDRAQNRKCMWVQRNQQVCVIATGLNDRAQNRKFMWVQTNQQVCVIIFWALSVKPMATTRTCWFVCTHIHCLF